VKALIWPSLVLIGMLSFALWTGSHVERRTEEWIGTIEEASRLAYAEQWEEAEERLSRGYESWGQSQTFFHTVMDHEDLDDAEALFAAAFAACGQRDAPDFLTTLSELTARLSLLAETQKISIQNIL